MIHLKTEIAFDASVLDDGGGGLFGRDDEGIEEVQLIAACAENGEGNMLPLELPK